MGHCSSATARSVLEPHSRSEPYISEKLKGTTPLVLQPQLPFRKIWQRDAVQEVVQHDSLLRFQTYIVLDWDDTLLFSSAIHAKQWTSEQQQALSKSVASLLQTAIGLGETVIITNGVSNWVYDSAMEYLPSIIRLLDSVLVISARADHEHEWPEDPHMWKQQAFYQLFAGLTQQNTQTEVHGTNMVVLGDSFAEIDAALSVREKMNGKVLVKTVKFKQGPTAMELVEQQRAVCKELETIASYESCESASMKFRPTAIPAWLPVWLSRLRRSPQKSWVLVKETRLRPLKSRSQKDSREKLAKLSCCFSPFAQLSNSRQWEKLVTSA